VLTRGTTHAISRVARLELADPRLEAERQADLVPAGEEHLLAERVDIEAVLDAVGRRHCLRLEPGPDLLEHGLRCGHEGRPPGGRLLGAPGHLNYKSLSYGGWTMSFGASRSRGARCYV